MNIQHDGPSTEWLKNSADAEDSCRSISVGGLAVTLGMFQEREAMPVPSIHISNFVRRQTAQSGFSHWTISDDELLARIENNFDKAKPGYRPDVLLVPIEPDGFFSSTVLLREGDRFVGEYVARKAGEDPRKATYVVSNSLGETVEKIEAVRVDVVLYSHAALVENGENDTDADYEIISINASPTDEEAPIPTGALIANHLQLSGGTATKMTDTEFVELLRKSVNYWKDKSSACPEHLKPPRDERVEQINGFMEETIARLYKEIEEYGVKVRDQFGHLLPQPQNDREKLMLLTGQISLALFVQGATAIV